MEITASQSNNITIVSLVGSIDSLTAEKVTNFFLEQVKEGKTKLVVDFSGVNYVSSAGLRTLIVSAKEARRNNGDFRVAALQPEILRVINVSGFGSVLKIYPDVVSGIASFE